MNKKLIFYLIIFLPYFFFQEKIMEWYDQKIVSPYLAQITSSDKIYFLVVILIEFNVFYLISYVIEQKHISNFISIISTFLLTCYISYRFFSDRYVYAGSPYVHSFKYADYFIILFSSILLIKIIEIFSRIQKPNYFTSPFIMDVPIEYGYHDKFNRKNFAIHLAEKIQSKLLGKSPGSLAIGINGVWGAGKTSFINLIVEALDKKNRIIISFNPWRSSSSSKIIEDFFELIVKQLCTHDSDLSDNITRYAKTLTEINENLIAKGLKSISEFLFDDHTKDEYYNKINSSIEKIKKQIIIFIDDLDRLDKKEIIEVLRIIRNTANFNNVVYVVAYDKEYVLEAIKTFNKNKFETFLEKIFQFEFYLPVYDLAVLRTGIKTILKQSLESKLHPTIDAAVDYSLSTGEGATNRTIFTYRDVVRFCNSFLFEIVGLENEVNIVDFYLIQILKLKYFVVYKTIAENQNLFFIREESKVRLRRISEKYLNLDPFAHFLGKQFGNPIPETNEEQSVFEARLRNSNLEITDTDKDLIIEIVNELLKEKDLKIGWKSRDYKAFNNWAAFDKYFTIQQLAADFSANDFEKYREGDYETYKNKIDEWLNKGLISEVLDRLSKISDFGSFIEWENHLKILIHIGKYQNSNSGPYGINYKQILETFTYPAKSNFQLGLDVDSFKSYTIEFFQNAPSPFVFESFLLNMALTRVDKIPLTDIEIEQQLLKYLKDYCDSNTQITDEFRALHRQCVSNSDGYGANLEIQPEAQAIFIDYFLRNLTSCQLGGFIRQVSPLSKYYAFENDWLKTFFPNIDELKAYLNTSQHLEKDNCFIEFHQFIEEIKANSNKPIVFEFKYLPIVKWV